MTHDTFHRYRRVRHHVLGPGLQTDCLAALRKGMRSALVAGQNLCPTHDYAMSIVTPWGTAGDAGCAWPGYRPAMVIDREWDEPVYQQVAAILRDQVASGKIEPRRPIPSVRTLCQTYGIARATATKAIHVLAEEGLIRRVPGKGWFVTPPAERQ